MSFYLFETADAAHGAFACRVEKFQADDENMLNGTTSAKVNDDADLPSFNDWDILVVTSMPRDALIVRGGSLISVHSMVATTREEKAAFGSASYKLAELAKVDRFRDIKQSIANAVNALKKEGVVAAVNEHNNLTINGKSSVWIDLREDRSSNYYGRRQGEKTNKISVTVGDYGDKSRYPQRKDGGHNYPEIAAKLVRYYEAQQAREKAHAHTTINRDSVKMLQDKYTWSSPWSFTTTSILEKPVRVERKLSLVGTPEEVEAYMTAVDKALADLASK